MSNWSLWATGVGRDLERSQRPVTVSVELDVHHIGADRFNAQNLAVIAAVVTALRL